MNEPLVLDNICEFIIDTKHKTPKFTESGYPCIRTPNIGRGYFILDNAKLVNEESYIEWTTRATPKENDLILAREAPVGNVAIIPPNLKVCHGQRTVLIRPNSHKVNPNYLMYLMLGDEVQARMHSMASGATVAHLNMSDIRALKLPELPDITEQVEIAGILKSYDNLIENNNRRIAILEEMAQSLYREWFVKFRFPGHECCQFKDSPLGRIPEGWGINRLDDYVVLQRGFDLPKKNRNENGDIPIYAASGINGYHDVAKVKPPGLVTGRSGTLGVVKLVLEDFWPLNTSLWVKEFKNCSACYGYYLLKSIGLEQFNTGAAVPTLNRNDVHGLNVASPPVEIIREFESVAESIFAQIEALTKKNNVLKGQCDMLLPKLISGNISL
jgi:type I restriction enzyme S subunit